jgi:hypothetical protein
MDIMDILIADECGVFDNDKDKEKDDDNKNS